MATREITDQEFDNKLEEIMNTQTGSQLLGIPGVYEIMSEYWNNTVIDAIEEDRYQTSLKDHVDSILDSIKNHDEQWVRRDILALQNELKNMVKRLDGKVDPSEY